MLGVFYVNGPFEEPGYLHDRGDTVQHPIELFYA